MCSKYPVDMVGLSFVNGGQAVRDFKKSLGSYQNMVEIVSKIDSIDGIKNFEEILSESDAVKIDRTSLNHEISAEKVFAAQKYMIEKANLAGKPIMTSSHMLESMANSPQASRADVSDVSSAVIDGTDYVILSNRATKGKYIFEALDQMTSCCLQAEKMMNVKYSHYRESTISEMMEQEPEQVEDSILPQNWMKEMNQFFEKEEYKTTGHVVDAAMRLKFAGTMAFTAASPFLHLAFK